MGRKKKKKTGLAVFILSTLLVLAGLMTLFTLSDLRRFYTRWKGLPPPVHKEYGVRVPTGYPITGIDVSRYQREIDWKKVKEMNSEGYKVNFVFAKAGEGFNLKDPQFENNRKGCKKEGIPFGAYHYFHPDKDPVRQADFFVSLFTPQKGDLPPVCDIEETKFMKPEAIRASLKQFLKRVEALTGMKPVLYSYHSFYQKNLKGHFDDYPLWIAHYGSLKPGTGGWAFWQFTERANISGIYGKVDLNVFSGSREDLNRLRKP